MTTKTTSVEDTLIERGKRYGSFKDHAGITQHLKAVMQCHPEWKNLEPPHKEALDMIVHKIGRISLWRTYA